MGKITGFMEYERIEEGYKPVAERLKNYKEFVIGLKADDAKVQAARCMDCGTPFCNSGCPVNNIIPDWNDLVFSNQWKHAATVLHATNNFPESTARIRPAPGGAPRARSRLGVCRRAFRPAVFAGFLARSAAGNSSAVVGPDGG